MSAPGPPTLTTRTATPPDRPDGSWPSPSGHRVQVMVEHRFDAVEVSTSARGAQPGTAAAVVLGRPAVGHRRDATAAHADDVRIIRAGLHASTIRTGGLRQ